jgi:catechol 2,3-dioxygenase-like lactoylglutathione lyase family enzyme
MLRLLLLTAAAVTAASNCALGALPEMYKSVDRVFWVVKDVDRVAREWGRVTPVHFTDLGVREHMAEYRGKQVSVKIRSGEARIGDVWVVWIQPLSDGNAFSDFLSRHGEGVMALVHAAPTLEAYHAEVDRLRGAGVQVLQRLGGDGPGYTLMDTEPQGKYTLAVAYFPMADPPLPPPAMKSSQFAFVVRDVHAVSAYWEKLGYPAMSYTHPALSELKYRGKPGQFDQELGWQRHGRVVYEWIQPLKSPTVYQDAIESHGEGVHHIAFDVADMEQAIALWTRTGLKIAQSGAWGSVNQAGFGRFAYVDTDPIGGLTVELLWNYKK